MCISINGYAQNVYNRGLHFSSFEVDQDNRTGLNLTPQKKLEMPNGFTMQFDIQLRNLDQTFGYVFRIIGNDSVNIDLVSDISSNEYVFSLVSGMKSLIQVRKADLKNFKVGSWAKITLFYNPQKKQINLKINDWQKTVAFDSKKLKTIDVFFGLNKHSSFSTTDVPPMTIRDILVFNEKKEVLRNWKLEKHGTEKVYDECVNQKASCFNPVWEIDKHVKWQQMAHLVLPYIHPQIAFDDENERLFIVNRKSVMIYNTNTEQIDSFKANKGEAYNCRANQIVYNKNGHKLVSYSFDNTNLAMFDFKTKEWSNENNQIILPQFWHHSKYFDIKDSTLITIGGYGYHKYKGDVMRYSFKNKEWKQHDISSHIPPRYLGSLGSLGNSELLYFGGYGSKTGNQEEFPRNYYDLYKINSQTLEASKIWELKSPDEHFTNGNSLVINKEKGVFYNLSYSNTRYSTSIKLMELSIDKPEYKILGDSILYKFKDIESYCDLYYCAKTSQLLAVTSVSKNNLSEINIYSIAYPPLQPKDVLQEEESVSTWKWYYLLILILTIPLYFIVKKRNRSTNNIIGNHTEVVSTFEYNVPEIELKPSSVNLLGCFQTVDIDGINITGSFTPTISQLFVLIILYSVKNGQGISSQELTDILWYDKDVDSARNNRNVNFSKLRLLLKKVGDLELINNNSYWSIQIGKDVFCDYKNVMYLIDLIKKQQQLNLDVVHEFVNIASRGVLLPNVQDEWLDSFKGDYTNLVIETLTHLSKIADISTNLVLLLRISDAILLHDNIDEDAAKLKVYALYNLGKKGQAKQYFEKFLEEYKSLMGNSFKESFDQFKEMKK
jgi:DNA-binding SARP family transcriptional activator